MALQFSNGLSALEKQKYNTLVFEMRKSDNLDEVKRYQNKLLLLKEKGLTRLRKM